MNTEALSGIVGFTATSLLLAAIICLVSIFVAWYTTRSRVKFSQIILGIFSYMLVMLLESVFSSMQASMGVESAGPAYAVYLMLSVVLSRELIRFAVTKFVLIDRFDNTDAAIGFGIGFAGFYVCICAAYYFNLYTTVNEYLSSGADAFFLSVGDDAEEAYALLLDISGKTGWQYILLSVNRVMYLVQEISLSVLLWYGFTRGSMARYLLLVPLMHLVAVIPDSLYAAGVFTNPYLDDVLTIILAAAIAAFAAWVYNRNEDQVAHFEIEKLRARRRR